MELWRWRQLICAKCKTPLGYPGVTAVISANRLAYICQDCAFPPENPLVQACRLVRAKLAALLATVKGGQ